MRTNKQIEVIVYKRQGDHLTLFLMLKRNPMKGGFWQPITGGVEDQETFEEAARRELNEETGIAMIDRLVNTCYVFEFTDQGREYEEYVFGVEVPCNTQIRLSIEHTEFAWATKEEALTRYLKWPGNKAGLEALTKIIDA